MGGRVGWEGKRVSGREVGRESERVSGREGDSEGGWERDSER